MTIAHLVVGEGRPGCLVVARTLAVCSAWWSCMGLGPDEGTDDVGVAGAWSQLLSRLASEGRAQEDEDGPVAVEAPGELGGTDEQVGRSVSVDITSW